MMDGILLMLELYVEYWGSVGLGYIRLITRVSVRYGEIFHEPKASEISHHISQLTSVIAKCFILIGTPPGSLSH